MPYRYLPVALFLLAALSTVGSAQTSVSTLSSDLPSPLTPDHATELAAEASVDVRTARLDLDAAERDLARVEADPTSLRVALLNARHAVDAANDTLRNASANARSSAADAFEAVLEADDRVRIADAAQAIARIEANAAAIRLEAGAATRSDVDRAEDAVRSAERDVRDARQALELATDRLAVRLAATDELPPLDDAPRVGPVPTTEDARVRLGENASLRATRRSARTATAQLEAVDVAFTVPRSEIEAARDRLASAELRANDLASSLDLAVRQARNAVAAAEGRLESAREQVATAEEDLNVQEARFEAGSIAAIDLERSRLDLLRRRADERTARH
ncbi:MAG: TolC family protein, partial [Trueperaceae bacterium]